MDIELLIHGTPNGQDYFGIKEEQTNIGLFYDNSTESVKFVIETKKQNNHAYVYYSYLRYKGIIGFDNRSGSYFGITLRFDKYYNDTQYIYNILDILFKRYVVGNLLTPSGDGYKYLISNFSTKTAEIEKLQQVLIQLLQATSIPAKFLDIDSSFIHPITSVPASNIADVSENAILASIKKYSKIVLSPDYETNIEKEYKQKLQDVINKGSSAQKDISSLKTTISDQKNKIAALEQDVRKKEIDIQQLNKNGNLTQLVTKIKEPITILANYFKSNEPKTPTPDPKPKNSKLELFGLASCIILSTTVLVLCILILIKVPKATEIVPQDPPEGQVFDSLGTKGNDEPGTPGNNISEDQSTLTTYVNLHIDVKGTNGSGSKISSKKTYIVTIKNGKDMYSGQGTWTLTNAKIIRGKEQDHRITIQPTGAGMVTLQYTTADSYTCPKCNLILEDFSTDQTKKEKETGTKTKTSSTPEQTPKITMSPNASEVVVGKEYSFSITGYSGKGEWKADGFSIHGDRNAISIKGKVMEGKEKAVISYYKEGEDKPSDKKEYSIKAN